MWLMALFLMGYLVYSTGIAIPYYADDFLFFKEFSCADILDRFLGKGRGIGFYRPIEAAFLACVQDHFGTSTVPIHIATISLHSLLAYLVFVALLRTGSCPSQAVLGSLFMLLSQANASAVMGNDTSSQISGTFFGCVSLWFLYLSFPNVQSITNSSGSIDWGRHSSSVFAFAAALLSKESSVSFFPLLFAVMLFKFRDRGMKEEKSPIRKGFFVFLPFVVVLVAYIAIRSLIGASQASVGSGRHNFTIGLNILENLTLLLFASVIPMSSVTAFTGIKSGQLGTVAVAALASLVFVGSVGYGLCQSRQWGNLFALGILAIGALFPMAMLNHVSELYAYNAMPLFAMIVGIGLGALYERAMTPRSKQIVVAMLCLLFASHIVAVRMKASLMHENGTRAGILLNEIQPYARRVPPGGELVLVNPDDNRPEYSIFQMRGFNVFRNGVARIKEMANRPDIKVKIIAQEDLQPARYNTQQAVVLTLEGTSIRVVKNVGNSDINDVPVRK